MAKRETVNTNFQANQIEGQFRAQPPLELLREIAGYLAVGQEIRSSQSIEYPVLKTRMKPEEALNAILQKDKKSGRHTAPLAAVAYPNDTNPELRLFEGLFGRDSLRISSFLLQSHPSLVEATLKELALLQGQITDIVREEEPGKIIHEHRVKGDSIREKLEKGGWGFPYYGAIDSTPLFIIVLGDYVKRVNPDFIKECFKGDGKTLYMAEVLQSALDWICSKMDENRDCLLEFRRLNPKGIINQAWKDSNYSYHHKDGTLANHAEGIASVEVQALAYDALLAADGLLRELNKAAKAESLNLRERAGALRQTVLEKFWHEEKGRGYFVLGVDRDEAGDLRQLRIKTSNMGHLLDSRILEGSEEGLPARRAALIKTLFSPELLSPVGIRTLASDEKRFHPFAYHNGSVWPWDNGIIARGLRRHGEVQLAQNIEERIISTWKTTGLFPEFVIGDNSPQTRLNPMIVDIIGPESPVMQRLAQPPQPIQGWTVAAVMMALEAKS